MLIKANFWRISKLLQENGAPKGAHFYEPVPGEYEYLSKEKERLS
ncbi:MAG: hypothetical protein V3U96_08705 [Paracoccaceae bacterium]